MSAYTCMCAHHVIERNEEEEEIVVGVEGVGVVLGGGVDGWHRVHVLYDLGHC